MLKYDQVYKEPNLVSICLSGQIAYLWCISPCPYLSPKTSYFFLHVCVCSQQCGCTFVWVHMHVHVKARDSCRILSSITLDWGKCFHWTWSSLVSEILPPSLWGTEITGRPPCHKKDTTHLFIWMLGIQTLVLMLAWQAFYTPEPFASSFQFFPSVSGEEYMKNQ